MFFLCLIDFGNFLALMIKMLIASGSEYCDSWSKWIYCGKFILPRRCILMLIFMTTCDSLLAMHGLVICKHGCELILMISWSASASLLSPSPVPENARCVKPGGEVYIKIHTIPSPVKQQLLQQCYECVRLVNPLFLWYLALSSVTVRGSGQLIRSNKALKATNICFSLELGIQIRPSN